jgi:hypothetical protein
MNSRDRGSILVKIFVELVHVTGTGMAQVYFISL